MIRKISYKVRVLRNGAYLTELHWPADDAPQISVKADGKLKSSISGAFFPNNKINWLKDELQPCIVIDGAEQPLGVFRPTTLSSQMRSGQTLINCEGYDRGWVVQAGKTEDILHLSAGASYIDSIQSLLVARGIGNVLAEPSAAVLPADREDWEIGTDYLSIINALLSEIGYNELWFDADGFAHMEQYKEPSAALIKRSYSARRGLRLRPMEADYSESTDVFDAPNVFICICDNADRSAVLKATAENTSFGAKSILQRGMRIPMMQKVSQIADQEALQLYADKLRDESLMGTREISFSVPAEAGHGVGDIISIEHEEIGGIYMEIGWSLRLAAGEMMSITVKRTVII